jgi:hypothetical protein
MRNLVTRLLRFPFVADFFIGRGLRDDIKLPAYGFSKMLFPDYRVWQELKPLTRLLFRH